MIIVFLNFEGDAVGCTIQPRRDLVESLELL